MGVVAAVPSGVDGPGWSSEDSGTAAGRFPLSVERHTMLQVDLLVPGVTTVTLNAQYYSLHALVAAHAANLSMTTEATQRLLRRAEVVMCGLSAVHLNDPESDHPGWLSQPHGYNKVWSRYRGEGHVDVDRLAADKVYAQPWWGFHAAYRGSELRLRVVDLDGRNLVPGPRLDVGAVRAGLPGLLELASRSAVSPDELAEHAQLCLCRMASRPDGAWLAARFAARGEHGRGDRVRRGTLQMLARAMELTDVGHVTDDVSAFVCFDPRAHADPTLTSLAVVPHWRGVMLRNASVAAWRDLWAWLVNGIDGLSPRSSLGDRLAGTVSAGSVRSFLTDLPATVASAGLAAPAERHPDVRALPDGHRQMAVLCLGARRARELEGEERLGFHGTGPADTHEELAPAWLADRLEDWADRPMADFARWLVNALINRSQRLALAKARRDVGKGTVTIPTRVHLRDEFIYRDSDEGGGPASLRLDQLVRIAAGTGLFTPTDGRWNRGDRGDLLDD